MSTDSNRKDLTELALHLRFVQLIIVVLSVVTAGFTMYYSANPVNELFQESLVLKNLANRSTWDQTYKRKACQREIARTQSSSHWTRTGSSTLPVTQAPLQIKLNGSSRTFRLSDPMPQLLVTVLCENRSQAVLYPDDTLASERHLYRNSGRSAALDDAPYPATLQRLIAEWNRISGGLTLYRVRDAVLKHALVVRRRSVRSTHFTDYEFRGFTTIKSGKTSTGLPVVDAKLYRLQSRKLAAQFRKKINRKISHYLVLSFKNAQGQVSDTHVLVPIVTISKSIPAEQAFRRHVGKEYAGAGGKRFAQMFPAMTRIVRTKKITATAGMLREAERIIREGKQTIDILGAEIDASQLVRLGAFLILIVLFYFWSVMRVLRSGLVSADRIPGIAWLGLAPDRTAFILNQLIGVFLPFTVCVLQVLLLYRGNILSFVVLSLVFVLAVMNVFNNAGLYRRLVEFSRAGKNLDNQTDAYPLVMHLRLSNLVLLLAATGIAGVSWYLDIRDYSRLQVEARAIGKVLNKARWDVNYRYNLCGAGLKYGRSKTSSTAFEQFLPAGGKVYVVKGGGQTLLFRLQNRTGVKYGSYVCDLQQQNEITRHVTLLPGSPMQGYRQGMSLSVRGNRDYPATMRSLERYWDDLHSNLVLFRIRKVRADQAWLLSSLAKPGDTGKKASGLFKVKLEPVSASASGYVTAKNVASGLYRVKKSAFRGSSSTVLNTLSTHYLMFTYTPGSGDVYRIVIPVETEMIPFNAQSRAARRVGVDRKQIVAGLFRESFPALQQFALEKNIRRTADIIPQVEKELKENKNEITVFGIRVHLETLVRFGAAIILIMMIYCWIFMRLLVNRTNLAGLDKIIPWTGVMPGRVAYSITLLTMVVLPALSVLYQLYKAGSAASTHAMTVTAIYLVILVIVSILLVLAGSRLYKVVNTTDTVSG